MKSYEKSLTFGEKLRARVANSLDIGDISMELGWKMPKTYYYMRKIEPTFFMHNGRRRYQKSVLEHLLNAQSNVGPHARKTDNKKVNPMGGTDE